MEFWDQISDTDPFEISIRQKIDRRHSNFISTHKKNMIVRNFWRIFLEKSKIKLLQKKIKKSSFPMVIQTIQSLRQ